MRQGLAAGPNEYGNSQQRAVAHGLMRAIGNIVLADVVSIVRRVHPYTQPRDSVHSGNHHRVWYCMVLTGPGVLTTTR